MKSKRPIHIIQIFDNSYEYGKNEKSYSQRKDKYKWLDKVNSKSGYIEDGVLKLCESKYENTDLNNVNVILLLDYNSSSEAETLQRFNYLRPSDDFRYENSNEYKKHFLSKEYLNRIEYVKVGEITNNPLDWKCFRFDKAEEIAAKLVWDYWEIGVPERENFKLCNLKLNKPVEINLNGKRDFSMTGRRERTFVERNFIIEYLGEISEIELLKDSNISFEKRVPQERKRINLLKELY